MLRMAQSVQGFGSLLLCALLIHASNCRSAELGKYFDKKTYKPEPLPIFSEVRNRLPSPIFDEDPVFVECYWKVWEIAFRNFKKPHEQSHLVSNYIDEAFNEGLFLWDTAFMTMFCNYAHPHVPGIQSLDNFYCSQMENGEIVREISEITGEPRVHWAKPGTPDSLNHPILAWAERESYRITGDRERLALIYQPLVMYYRSYAQIREPETGFYRTSWATMDNSPRNDGVLCGIDTTSELVLFARDLSYIAKELGKWDDAKSFELKANRLARNINERLWDGEAGFYFDWSQGKKRHNVWTIAPYWTLLAGVASKEQAEQLVLHLKDKDEFKRPHMVPTVPANQEGYHPDGHYWRGGVWAPTNTMVIRGLERYGYVDLAREIALNHLKNVIEIWKDTGTVWEFYAPDEIKPGILPGHNTRRDFVGWTGIGPIMYFIEYAIGIQVDAPSNTIHWDIRSPKRVGIERLWFGGKTVSLVCDEADSHGVRRVKARGTGRFVLVLRHGAITRRVDVPANQTMEIVIQR